MIASPSLLYLLLFTHIFESSNHILQSITMSQQEGPVTAYTWQISAQDQQGGPGLDKDMKEQANWTQLEYWDDNGKPYLKEYEGRGLLQDKAVLITGGDSGIGRSVAILMAREGADVSILYLPEEEEDAQYTIKQIEKAGRKGHGMQYDLKEESNCKAAIDEHIKVFGKLNVLVNNASMQESCEDHREIDISVVTKTFQTNIIQMMALSKYALQHMKRGDNIVNSASVLAYMGDASKIDYSSTKGAIVTFTRALAKQQAPRGIRVNAVAPGIIWTPLQPATANVPAEGMKNVGVGMAPMNRTGMPIEIATAYIQLASPLGSYFTGECIHGTGGIEMQG
ncbi:short chain dehydrogenase/ reductase-like protein [Aureobasidium pullulans]|uniref:Short chain dehydrogenase/ reductase-like protein n=1 Tax=Aureobasidium pullulans TaxID=5580 RepID=A0A4S8YVC5_AURPU|nr:short chain dehydrogenase/ reductase-like protein [Aureobasidium pullulans]THW56761.1 short chain dehydrogenase/ reductase-like protein [Aureobasidium pullulans]THX08478.1 short chain dehydrogenase/ reductase-like protein [Aureobasidium pullulans]THZ90103.1 short chain dehydrogenase/ reductase-like protein [Aureobasidium pullulans]